MSRHQIKAVQQINELVCPVPDFHGASIVTEEGNEIPITEKMVRSACNKFIEMWESNHKQQH